MKTKLAAVIAVVGCSCVAFAALAGAHGSAETKVTIKAESGGFYGFVKSSKTNKCANGRKVKLYKQTGKHQVPSEDKKIGSDIAQPNGDGVMWSTGNTGSHSGKFYARVGKISGCKSDTSKTIHAQP